MRIYATSRINGVLQTKIAQQKAQQRITVQVGYSAPYAMQVHESVGMVLQGLPRGSARIKYTTSTGKTRHRRHKGLFWDPQGKGRAKFLEIPASDQRVISQMNREIEKAMNSSRGNLRAALMRAGRILRDASLEYVPVEFGTLKKSAFVQIIQG